MAEEKIAAAVDIGTNSVKLTVGRKRAEGNPEVLLDQTRITRLGKGVGAGGRLTDEAVRATIAALSDFGRDARSQGAEVIAAVGTSALRDAENGPDFVRDAEKALGGRIEIISGDREAELIYRAARHDSDLGIPAGKEVILVTLDIGGGSTEIVIGQGARIYFRDSLQLGAVRLTERALPSDPPSASELAEAREVAEQTLAAVLDPPSGAVTLVGSGGTIANLAAMELLAEKPGAKISPDVLHGTRLTLRQIETRTESLAKVAPAERRKTPGLEPDRADVIVAGAIIVAAALRRLGVEAVTVSARGLRFGLLYELLSH